MLKPHVPYHFRRQQNHPQETSERPGYNTIHPSNLTTVMLGVFMLGVVAGILISVTHHNIFGVFHGHITRGKVHQIYTPLERQRLNVSVNQKLAKAKY